MRRIASSLIEKFKKSIQLRLTVSFIAILIPLTAVSLYMNERSQSILESETSERITGALHSAMEYIDLTLSTLDELSVLISNDPNLLQLLNKEQESTPTMIVDLSTVISQLTALAAHNRTVSQIAIYHETSRFMISSSYGGRQVDDRLLDELHRQAVAAQGGRLVYLPPGPHAPKPAASIMEPIDNPNSVTFYRRMDLNRMYEGNHLLLITVQKDKFTQLFRSLVPGGSNSVLYLLSERHELIASTDPAALEVPYEGIADSGSVISELPGFPGKWFVLRVQSPHSKWSLVMLQPEEELLKHTKPMHRFTYLIIALSLLLAIGISLIIYAQISSPLLKLSGAMKRMLLGRRDVEVVTDRQDEFGHITRVFNQMAEENRHLIEDIYENRLRLMQTELKFLQSQINPHFLNNTLDCIYWMSKNYEADEIGEMVLNLSRFFRLSLNSGAETFTIAETIEHLKYYIRIQQLRFAESFTVEYDVDEQALDVPVLKLVLQPFVENAIVHGMEKLPSGGLIRILVRRREARLVVTVEDNGAGIAPERLDQLLLELAQTDQAEPTETAGDLRIVDMFGMKNVKRRLRLYYGPEADLHVASVEGRGTTVTVTIPLKGV